jgi:hypothetical protein
MREEQGVGRNKDGGEEAKIDEGQKQITTIEKRDGSISL